jgi:hypothetical protein
MRLEDGQLTGQCLDGVRGKLRLAGEESMEGRRAVGLRERREVSGDDLGVAGRELAGEIEFMVGYGMMGDELID